MSHCVSQWQEAMEAFKDMVQLARAGTATEFMTDLVLIWLMKSNAIDNKPGNILEVLLVRSLIGQGVIMLRVR